MKRVATGHIYGLDQITRLPYHSHKLLLNTEDDLECLARHLFAFAIDTEMVDENTFEIELAGSPEAKLYTSMLIRVGYALSTWTEAESHLADFYAALICGDGSPAEGALVSWASIASVEARLNIIRKVLDQVLFPDIYKDFRTKCKKAINRISTLSEARNKIAHGKVVIMSDFSQIAFFPFFLDSLRERDVRYEDSGARRGIMKRTEMWNLSELQEKSNSLQEAVKLSIQLKHDLSVFYVENRESLLKRGYMSPRPGLPFQNL